MVASLFCCAKHERGISYQMKLSIPLILASASPRRKELLGQIVDSFDVCVANIIEEQQEFETPEEYVARLAQQKAQAVAANNPQFWVLGADTIVVQNSQVFEKPKNQADFERMMKLFSASSHQVLTAIALVKNEQIFQQTIATTVTFRKLTNTEIESYWLSGEPQDKAGGYGIQGLAASFVEKINGNYGAVVGLPLCQTYQLLSAAILEK